MAISMRDLFSRRDRVGEFVSIRNALKNHLDVSGKGLRELHQRFTEYNTESGFRCGCRKPDSFKIDIGIKTFEIGGEIPAWVHAVRNDPRERPRYLEGVLKKSRLTNTDFPLKPWHTFYDWNYFVEVDPQFHYLLNETTAKHHTKGIMGSSTVHDIIECEWDTAFVPLPFLPPVGSRIWIYGRWIFDCGHPDDESGFHRLEIHPPKATAWFRSEAVQFEGNSGPTRANNAVLYIGRKGGYIDQAINNEDYEFDIPLPPRPHPDAVPLHRILRTTGFPVVLDPRFSPFPENDPKVMRVTVPLKGAPSSLEEYGGILAAGWSDPAGTEVRRVKRFRVTLEKVIQPEVILGNSINRHWLFFVAINGLWVRRELTDPITDLNIIEDLDLHEEDHVQITACGFLIRNIFGFMGASSSVSPTMTRQSSSHEDATRVAEEIRDTFADLVLHKDIPTSFDNTHIHNFSHTLRPHNPAVTGRQFKIASANHLGPREDKAKVGYELVYRIDEI